MSQLVGLRLLALSALLLVGCASAGEQDPAGGGTTRDAGAKPSDMRRSDGGGGTGCPPCSGQTPVCDSATKKCVACLANTDCSGGAVCRDKQCVGGCDAQRGCDAGTCNVDAGVCVGCVQDADCKDPKDPVCDPATARCVPCTPMKDKCPAGSFCSSMGGKYVCTPGCRNDAECQAEGSASSRCCSNICVDTDTDDTNCGACKTACKLETCCGGQCVDTSANLYNCGACYSVCSARNAVADCSGGFCQVLQCNNDWGDCDGNPANGCEADLDGDSDHCGRCGDSCFFACLSGSCFPF